MANDSSVHLGAGGTAFGVRPALAMEEDRLNLRQLLDLIRAGRWTIVLMVMGTFFVAAAYCFLTAPTYRADGLVQIEQSASKGVGIPQQLSEISSLVLGTPVETQAEIQVLRSRMILDQVISKLNFEISVTPKLFPLIGGAIYRANHAATEPVSVPSFLRSYAWGGESVSVPTWDVPDAFLNKLFTLTRTDDGFVVNLQDRVSLQGHIGETVSKQTGEGTFTIFVREFRATPGTKFRLIRVSRQDVLDGLSKKLQIGEQGKQSGVISLAYEGKSPDEVASVINTVEDSYLRQNVERRSATAQQSLDYLQKQLPQLKEQVDNAQLRLNAYQSTHGSVDVTEETQLVLRQTVNLDSQRLQLQQQREEFLQRFTPEHPTIRAIDEQIRSLDAAKAKVVQQVQKLPNTQQEIFGLIRDLDVSNALYAQMLNSIQELQVAKAGTVGNVRIVDRALKPFKPASPKPMLALPFSIMLGLVAGVVAVVVQRALIRGVDDPTELESRLGLVTYAMIPFSSAQKQLSRRLRNNQEESHFILARLNSHDVAIEAIRSLRTSLHFAMLEAPNNIVMLTGPAPSLGKSFVSLNLGAVLALSGKKVVCVDADLRKGHLHRYVSRPALPGVSDFVAGNAELAAICYPSPVDGLYVVFRGTNPPNPSELLMHERFAGLMRELSEHYDYVIVDTPPVLAVTDAAIVGRLAGSTLLVLKSAEHSLREIEEAYKRLATAGVSVKGALFNQVGARAGSYGYGNYGYTYYRYDTDH